MRPGLPNPRRTVRSAFGGVDDGNWTNPTGSFTEILSFGNARQMTTPAAYIHYKPADFT